jgi:hypothetical protein
VTTHNLGTVTVTFASGWVTPGQNAVNAVTYPTVDLPEDIQQACIEVATAMYRRQGRDADISSTNLGVGAFSYDDKHSIPTTARQLLMHYRKVWG